MKSDQRYTIVYEGPVEKGSEISAPEIETQSRDRAHDLQILLTGVNLGSAIPSLKNPADRTFPELRLKSVGADPTIKLVMDLASNDPRGGKHRARARRDLLLKGIEIGAAGSRPRKEVLNPDQSRLLTTVLTKHLMPNPRRYSRFAEYQTLKKDISRALQDITYRTETPSPDKILAETKVTAGTSVTGLAELIARTVPGVRRNPQKFSRATSAARSILDNVSLVTHLNFSAPEELTVDIPSSVYASLAEVHSQLYADPKEEITRVAVWDLGARVGHLQKVLELLNEAQQAFEFYSLLAPLPSGLESQRTKVLAWAKKHIRAQGGRLTKSTAKDIHNKTIIDADFYRIARTVRGNISPRPDILAGLTPVWIAGIENDSRPCFDFFSSSSSKMVLVSTTDIRKISEKTNRPFEIAVAVLVISQVFVAANPALQFHSERGCLFDEEDDRFRFARTLRKLRVEDRCLRLMRVDHRAAIQHMIEALERYRPSASDDSQTSALDPIQMATPQEAVNVHRNLKQSESS